MAPCPQSCRNWRDGVLKLSRTPLAHDGHSGNKWSLREMEMEMVLTARVTQRILTQVLRFQTQRPSHWSTLPQCACVNYCMTSADVYLLLHSLPVLVQTFSCVSESSVDTTREVTQKSVQFLCIHNCCSQSREILNRKLIYAIFKTWSNH